MKKITLVLTPVPGGDEFTTTLPNGSVARFCKSAIARVFGLNEDESYKLSFRQTITENPTTLVRLKRGFEFWNWVDVQNSDNSKGYTNYFLGSEIDTFLDETFGTGYGFVTNTDVFFRVTVSEIV